LLVLLVLLLVIATPMLLRIMERNGVSLQLDRYRA